MKLEEIAGWYGTFAILGAYALVSFSYVSASSILYQLLNLTGALGIVVVSLRRKVYQPAVLNIFWALIALLAIAGTYLPR